MFLENSGILLVAACVICAVTSIVTEITKGIGFLAKIPTDLEVLVLSVVLTLLAYFAYITYAAVPVVWFHVIAAVLAGFILALVCTRGWNYVINIFKRFLPPGEE
ncbi:MAG: hypothetical protein LUD53_03500 [Clostridiales bacterium]|nr:hypothetical protein [Clostridiales bacterium]